ncbi:MAG TPA: MmcQ/YjbR family DNA-binding protein [Blastocatellia bacterium]
MTGRQSKTRPRCREAKPVTYETVRRLALALPDVEEDISGGAPVFRVRGKMMVRLRRDEESLLIKVDYLKRDILLNAEPKTFYVTDFYRCHPMMFVRLSGVDGETLRDLLEQAWRLTAPKRLAEAYDGDLSR